MTELRPLHPMTIKDKLEDEGSQARNLIKFNVPMRDRKKLHLPLDTKMHTNSPKSELSSACTPSVEGVFCPQECGDVSSLSSRVPLMIGIESVDLSKSTSSKSGDYRARYWGQMMDTLKRTIDEIYSACETDESEVECKEVIMILEHSKKDFHSLIEKMNLFKEIENSTTENRPPFIAWDERKISPGKPIMRKVIEQTKRAHSHSGQSSSDGKCNRKDILTSFLLQTMSQTELQPSKDASIPVDDTCALADDIVISLQDASNNNVPDNISDTSTRQNSESGTCTWADKVKSKLTLQKNESRESLPIKQVEKIVGLKDKFVNKSINKCQSIKSNIVSKESKVLKNDGEWETVCRSKFSQRLRNGAKTNCQTLIDRPTRKSLSAKHNTRNQQNGNRSQYLKRNKSKSENNLQLKDIRSKEPVVHNSYETENMVVKSHSSMSISNNFNTTNSINSTNNTINIFQGLQQYISMNETSLKKSSRKKSWSSPQEKNKASSTQSCFEIYKYISEKYEPKINMSKSEDGRFIYEHQIEYSNISGKYNNDYSFINCIDSDTFLDNSNDEFGDDDETTHNIKQLNKKLADVENVETELQNELGRAQEEEKAYREQIEQEEEKASRENIDEDIEINDEVVDCLTDTVEISSEENVKSFIQDDENDDGYDIILNINPDQSSAPLNINTISQLLNKSLLQIEEMKDTIVAQPQLDWSQMVDEQDDENEWEDSIAKMRTPGRGVEMHQKLSAPSRRRSINSIQQLEEKQIKAKILREKLLLDRTERVRELTKKVEEVRQHKCELLEEKKVWMAQRLQKAEVKRQQQLDERVKKAHDEEIKGKEIAFIQSLEAAQKQFTIFTKHQESEARLLERQEERKKKMEEKAVREVAAETRRKKIETKRQAWLSELQQRWKTRDEELASKAESKERQRRDAMRAKEVERELKKIVLEQQQKTHIEQLKEKILKKHEDSERRHQEQLAEISRKAFEMSVAKYSLEDAADAPPIETYINKKWCNVCNVMIDSDVILQSHLSGKKHKSSVKEQLMGDHTEKDQIRKFNLEHIVDAPEDKADPKIQAKKERRKVVKKRVKKIKHRMTAQTPEFEKMVELIHKNVSYTINKQKYIKYISDMRRYLAIKDSGPWVSTRVTSLEKILCDLDRCIDIKKSDNCSQADVKIPIILAQVQAEQNCFLALGGLKMLSNIVELLQMQKSENNPVLPEKTYKLLLKCVRKLCISNNNVCQYILYSNFITNLLDGIQTKLAFFIPENFSAFLKSLNQLDRELPTNVVVEQILQTLTIIFDNFVISSSSESIYTVNYKVSGDNSGRSSSQSNASSWIDTRSGENQKIQDIVSYVVSTGTIDKLSDYLSQVRGPLKESSTTANFVLVILSFLSSLLRILTSSCSKSNAIITKISIDSYQREDISIRHEDSFKAIPDRTQLLSSIEGNEMCGLICLMYGLLLYQGNCESNSENLPSITGKITITGLKLINNFAILNISAMQTVLSQEGTSLQLRHILSYLLFYCNERLNGIYSRSVIPIQNHNKGDSSFFSVPELLHEVIICIGYFCVNNNENQNFVQTGQRPTILQQLCQLPFAYFSQKNLVQCLYPTLISCCYNNKENTTILELEMTCGLLSGFIEEKMVEAETSDGLIKNTSSSYDSRFELHSRFPVMYWSSAKQYFER